MLKQLDKRPNIATWSKNLTDDSHGWTTHLIITEEVSDDTNLELCFVDVVSIGPFRVRVGKSLYEDEKVEKK